MENNSRVIKIQRMDKLLSCSYCSPHRGENRTKWQNYRTKKNWNFQAVKEKLNV